MSANHHSSSHTLTDRHPHFAPRQHLTANQLNGLVEDELKRQRRLNIALHGYGVVSGYQLRVDDQGHLKVDEHRIDDISCGMILDRYGRDLYWRGGPLGMRAIVGKQPDHEGEYLLRAHYAEQRVPGEGCSPCQGDRTQWIERSVVFTLTRGCEKAPRECPEVEPCTTLNEFVCARTGSEKGKVLPALDLEWICEEPAELCPSECGEWHYDPDAGVPIACVWVEEITPENAECDPKWGFAAKELHACAARPFVHRTPLLFELIRGCHIDLARVRSLSWEGLLKPSEVSWEAFEEYFKEPFDRFSIEFTKPIRTTTLHEGSVFLSAVVEDTDYRLARRIPLHVEPLNVANDLASGVRLVPIQNRRGVYDWIEDEIWGENSELARGCRIELTIRGHLLRDECGRTLNAIPIDVNPIGELPKWAGQDQPGDDFHAVFRVGRRDKSLHNQTPSQAS